jgi:hypothetical protein
MTWNHSGWSGDKYWCFSMSLPVSLLTGFFQTDIYDYFSYQGVSWRRSTETSGRGCIYEKNGILIYTDANISKLPNVFLFCQYSLMNTYVRFIHVFRKDKCSICVQVYIVRKYKVCYSKNTFTKSLSFYMTAFSASLTKLTAFLPQSRDSSCYVDRPVLAPPPLWLHKHTDPRAHEFAHCPNLWHQPMFAYVTCT